VFTTFSSIPVISISNAQRRPVPQANWVRTIHHGLPEKLLTPRPVTPGYLAVLGRIAPEKGVDRAIKIAIRCGIPLKIAAKVPGPTMRMRTVNMDFFYGSSFLVESPDAYERLVLDCMLGDPTLFAREDEVEQAWSLADRIEARWQEEPAPAFPNYAAGSWGPESADALIERDGRRWRRP